MVTLLLRNNETIQFYNRERVRIVRKEASGWEGRTMSALEVRAGDYTDLRGKLVEVACV
jgi:hypothetical protein